MANRRIVTFGGYFEAFIASLPERVIQKIDYGLVLLKTMDRLPAKHMKYVEDGIFELRTEFEGNIYRTFFIFDGNQVVYYSMDSRRRDGGYREKRSKR